MNNMKQKIFSLLVMLVVAVTGAWAQDADNCPKIGQLHKRVTVNLRRVAANYPSEAIFAFDCSSGYQYGVASDGEYIYTSSWSSGSSSMFYKYDLDGNFIEEFNISGCGYCRDLTYDGTYFYGVANGNTIYQIDFESKTVVGTITTDMSMRCVTYDEKRDGFWVAGNWVGPLALYDRSGNKIQEGIYADSASGIAYYEDITGEEHILQASNGLGTLNDYNITTNTLQDNVLDLTTMPGYNYGTSGGCFIGEYNGQICLFADMQQSPNRIAVYQLPDAKKNFFDLIKADDAEVHGTVQFNIGEDEDLEEDVSSAKEGDKVTVIVTPEDGYMVAEVTGEWQAAIARAPRRAAIDMMRDIDLQFVSEDATTRAKTYTFEMIRADAEISCTYKKLLTHPDITVDPIGDQPYLGEPIEPEVVVKDGETTLVLGTDYTVTYVNNVEIGTATVIITAVASSNYSGSIQTTFEIITNRLVLETSIANAWNYYNSIKDTNPDVAAWLKEAIDAAQEVLDNEDASQRELGDAANVLNDAVIAAQTEVDAKRITITIPAKSYVARIDADKRTIDEGVAGVSIYSVKSVTDSEVELTAELGIVPEETPYIIYNNNDEDVTISIVFTHEAPDDVTYDSEHFKGTLTDKAITDEDLQAADYYTLTEGLDFTKMQAAATVAANQCWIELAPASDAHASSLTIVPEGGTTPTGIADNKRESITNNRYYDLNGRQLNAAPTQKGVYILNGKKVVVK